ncbi:FUSC family protein [Pararhizobium polonicum]|uniref:FUSC family protein n=1 Tax=Pararhizobium polonicum TaxID=1612624 RepID=UPI001314865E|nr:FUSC family protein [Pararhizobium polonicum]
MRFAITALIAIAVAVALGIPNPYWAAMPVWAMSQPTRGLLLERGVFRLIGSLIGAFAGFALLSADLPFWLALTCFSVWILAMTACIPMMRGVHGYAPLLAAMTAAIIVIPALLHPVNALELALARVNCTFIGFVVGFALGFYLTPRSDAQAFERSVRQIALDALIYGRALLSGQTTDHRTEHLLLKELADAQINASIVSAGSIGGYRRRRDVQALAFAVIDFLSVVHSHVNHRGMESGLGHEFAPQRLAGILDLLTLIIDGGIETDVAAGMAEAYHIDKSLAETIDQIRVCASALLPTTDRARHPDHRRDFGYFSPFRDTRLAVESGLVAGVATFAAVGLASTTAIPGIHWAVLGLSITTTMLMTHPAPDRVGPVVLKGVLIGIAFAVAYRALILPHVVTPLHLIASLAPFLLIGGLARARKKTAAWAFDANQLFLLASHASLPSLQPGSDILWEAAALAIGVGIPCVAIAKLRLFTRRRIDRLTREIGMHLSRAAGVNSAKAPNLQSHFRHPLGFSLLRHSQEGRDDPSEGYSSLAAYRLLRSIEQLRLYRDSPDSSSEMSDLAASALSEVRKMHLDPLGTASRLLELQTDIVQQAEARAIRDAAFALRECHLFFASKKR